MAFDAQWIQKMTKKVKGIFNLFFFLKKSKQENALFETAHHYTIK